jgi:AcrR family transcriptional regulator
VRVVDEEGPAGFNMRELADRLETSTATLYRHVTGKEELMVYVVDRVLGEVRAPEDSDEGAPRDWREGMRRFAFQFRSVLARHPSMLPLFVVQLPLGPNALTIRERVVAMLTRFGFSAQLAARSYNTVAQYVLGSAITRPGSPMPEEAAAIGEYYRALDREAYPHVVAAADALTTMRLEEGFIAGLEIVLDGIDRARGCHPQRNGSP